MDEFLFYGTGVRRNRTEQLYDILIVAKDGLGKTRIMYKAHLSWIPMGKLIKLAEAEGLIEEVEVPKYALRGRRGSLTGWKTTEKGLKYAKDVYDNSKLFQEAKEGEVND